MKSVATVARLATVAKAKTARNASGVAGVRRNVSAMRNQRTFATTAEVAKKFYPPESPMFCFQCEQTRDGKGCSTVGVCGKDSDVAALQDLLVHINKGISQYALRLSKMGLAEPDADLFVMKSLFATLTNVNFDSARFVTYLKSAQKLLDSLRTKYEAACKSKGLTPERLTGPALTKLTNLDDVKSLVEQGNGVGINPRREQLGNADILGLQELITYGLKGACAYAEHAEILGKMDADVNQQVHEVLDFLATADAKTPVDAYLGMAMKVGAMNLRIMELLDAGGTEKFGHPTPTKVRVTPVKGKCILVSGHDLNDLELILKQTEGKGINVYTHGELLPAHGYPGLKKYKHLVGNYGGAWQLQKLEFSTFPGPIVVTTNCLVEPKKSYKDRIFTRNVVGFSGIKHIATDDFSEVINIAQNMEGFKADDPRPKDITVGFGRNAVMSVAPAIIDAVKSGKLKHFFLIGGCDGAEGERNYFRDVALNAPKDTAILTLACGKYRFNKMEFGEVAGLPRLLDIGQCNDAYSAIQIASALAKAFGTDVNGLPLSFVISWFEQKAVAVLLTLLHLGVKNIHLGPHLPAFATPNMLNILVSTFGLKPTGNAAIDLDAMLNPKKAASM
eukprot:TRINITY_DN3938_c0_g1_i1.p1 TRINITY_DN3938_c0_g1~~TRINITY_DN3938_c0_g1_i1.p1  ORF type:complete len:618 (+),score=189.43 TRINITY_DN3938_c0_g1_i1:73-1926(+)